MMGLPAVSGNPLMDAAFYISCAVILLGVLGFVAWLLADKWRFRNEHDEADKTIEAARFAAAADLSKIALSESRAASPFAPRARAAK